MRKRVSSHCSLIFYFFIMFLFVMNITPPQDMLLWDLLQEVITSKQYKYRYITKIQLFLGFWKQPLSLKNWNSLPD